MLNKIWCIFLALLLCTSCGNDITNEDNDKEVSNVLTWGIYSLPLQEEELKEQLRIDIEKQIQKEKNENIRLMKLAEEEDKRRLESEKKIIEKHILADKKREEQELIEMKNTIELQEQKLLLELEEQAKADAHKYTQ